MAPFICCLWSDGAAPARRRVELFEADLTQSGVWQVARTEPGCRVFGVEARPAAIRQVIAQRSLVIGDLFDAQGQPAPDPLPINPTLTPTAAARAMLDRFWGRYIFVMRGPDGMFRAALRDPCGAGDTAIWTSAGLTVLTNALPAALAHGLLPKQGLDWAALHALAADPFFAATTSPFKGVTALASGALALPAGHGFALEQIWRPSAFASDPISETIDVEADLRDRVDRCVAAYARQPGAILAEVSGGFDSSIVTDSLERARAPVVARCHHYTADPSGDERPYARALGEHLGVEILFRPRPSGLVSPDLIGRSQFGLRPSAHALDPVYDEEALAIARGCGAQRLFTGLGGDGLFYSMPLASIGRDRVRRRGLPGLLSPDLGDLARWSRKSIWTVARAVIAPGQSTAVFSPPRWVAPQGDASMATPHPWLQDIDGLSRPKRVHVEEQVLALLTQGTSLRGRTLDLVNPLLSQPILELCLRIPVDRLVEGGRDRALARRAFAARLPAAITARRSKGELGLYYGKAVAEGLPKIRDFLLGGRLLEEGVLVCHDLEAVLDEAYLAQHGWFSGLLFTVAIEAWVRRWEDLA